MARPGARFRIVATASVLLAGGLAGPGRALAAETKSVTVVEEACPPEIQDPSQWNPGFLPDPCRVAAGIGTIAPPPDGVTYDPEPLLFDVQIEVTGVDGAQTVADAEILPNEFCDPATPSVCQVGVSYRWAVASGPVTVRIVSVPAGYRFGWATGESDDTQAVHPDVDTGARTIEFDLDDWIGGVTISAAHFVVATSPGPPQATPPPTSTRPAVEAVRTRSPIDVAIVVFVATTALFAALFARRRRQPTS